MATDPVSKIGVLGLGSIGLRHARLLQAHGVAVVGFDPSDEAGRNLGELGGTAASRATVIDECDALIIATPSEQHLADLAAAVAARKPALVEKPLGQNLDAARHLVARAAEQRTTIAAAFNLRFRSVVLQVRDWMADPVLLGEPVSARFVYGSYLPDWRPAQDYTKGYAADPVSGGVIFDTIHEFDLASYLLGPARIAAAAAARSGLLDIASEDHAVVALRHDTGVLSTLHLDYLRRPPERTLEIVGSRGVLNADLRRGTATVTATDGSILCRHAETIERDDEYRRQLQNFLAAVAAGSEPECSGAAALHSLELALSARAMAGLPSAPPEIVALGAGDRR